MAKCPSCGNEMSVSRQRCSRDLRDGDIEIWDDCKAKCLSCGWSRTWIDKDV